MDRLTTLDAGFLEAEDSDPHVSLAIGALAVVDGPMPDHESLVETLTERIRGIPRCRQVLRTHTFDLSAPELVDDDDFDPGHHLHRAALPRPGDDAALHRFIADIMSRRLDRDRPLWQCWIIEGLEDDRWAILMKIHHCLADGIAAARILSALCDGGPTDTFADHIRAASERANRGVRIPKPTLNPLNWIAGMWNASAAITAAATRALGGAMEIAGGLITPAAGTSLTGSITGMRRYSAARVSLADVAKVCDDFDVTINDVALAAITDSFREILVSRGERPRRTSLRTLVPVSVRSNADADKTDNRVSVMLPYLPVEESDAVEQLRAVHDRLRTAKGSGQRQAGSAFVAAANAVPFTLSAWVVRAFARLPQRSVVTVATNVPGPRKRVRLMGRDVVRVLPVTPIALQLRTAIAMLSYADELVFGITADYDAAPDVDDLAKGIERAVARLVAISGTPRRFNGTATLALMSG